MKISKGGGNGKERKRMKNTVERRFKCSSVFDKVRGDFQLFKSNEDNDCIRS